MTEDGVKTNKNTRDTQDGDLMRERSIGDSSNRFVLAS